MNSESKKAGEVVEKRSLRDTEGEKIDTVVMKNTDNINKDRALLELLNCCPDQGLEAILDEYGAAVETICRNFLYDCSQEDREEAVADTFFKLWKYREQIRMDENSSLKTYLYQIARNTARDFRKKKSRQPVISMEEAELIRAGDDFSGCNNSSENKSIGRCQEERMKKENPEQIVLQREMEQMLHQVVGQLKEPDRTIFIARYFYGFSIREAAEKAGITVKKAENILYRGKKRLEQALRAYM